MSAVIWSIPLQLQRNFPAFRAVPTCLLLAAVAVCGAAQQPSTSSSSLQAKELRGHLSLASGDQFCVSVPLHPDRVLNLGAARLTVTFSADRKQSEDVVLVAKLTKAQVTLTQVDTAVPLCGVVPALNAKQYGAYVASDFAIHLGSGNVTNIGSPDDHLVDTGALAAGLQALRVSFAR